MKRGMFFVLSILGAVALRAAEIAGVPAFAAVGESSFWTVTPMGYERARRHLGRLTGFVAVSGLLREMLQSDLRVPAHKIGVFPNGVDLTRFRPLPRADRL